MAVEQTRSEQLVTKLAGIPRGRDKIIDEFLAPVRGLFEIRDDRVFALREYMDTAYILERLE
jgi:hypothetical protein